MKKPLNCHQLCDWIQNLLLITFFALFALGQLQRIQLTESIAFYLHDFLIVEWLFFSLIFERKKYLTLIKQSKISQHKLEIILLLWLVTVTIFNWLSTRIDVKAILYIVRLIVYFTLAIKLYFLSKRQAFMRLAWVLTGFFILLAGLLQYVFLPDTRFLYILGWDDHYYRLISTQLDPAYVGIILSLTLVYLQSLFEFKKNTLNKHHLKLKKIGLELLLITGILLTYSRASYLAAAVSLILLSIYFVRKKITQWSLIFMIYLILAGLAIPFLPRPGGEGAKLERTSSIWGRIESDKAYLQALNTRDWIIGKGFFATDTQKHKTALPQHAQLPDNLLVTSLYYSGLIGTGILLLVLSKWSYQLYQKDYTLAIALLAILSHSMFNNTLLQPFVLLMFLGGIASMKKRVVWK